jgi:hypothetical protein
LDRIRIQDHTQIEKEWGLGFVWLNRSKKGPGVRNAIAYTCKYLLKTWTEPEDKNLLTQAYSWLFYLRAFSTSKGLLSIVMYQPNPNTSFLGILKGLNCFIEDYLELLNGNGG